ncbi:MAG: hypothetical protein JWR69_4579 [Pedosphaera sp.]|nr:hypothetical protein [Pedosphaera sp.]
MTTRPPRSHAPTVRALFVIVASVALLAGLPLPAAARTEPPTGNRITINADNVLLINGRKTFPIGFTLAPPPDSRAPNGKNGLKELADAGATFMRTGANGGVDWNEQTISEEQKWEDAAARYGLYCWPYLRDLASITGQDTPREAMLRKVVNHFKDHPGFGIWKGADEPEWGKHKIPPLVRARAIIKELDPNHPLAIIQAPRGTVQTLRPYNAACDIIGTDIYPISYPPGTHSLLTNKEISMVGDYTRTMMELSDGKMPVWMVLQIAWSGVVKPGKTLRFPTFPEERFMSYQAIINGARGLVYFGGSINKAMSPEDAKLGWNWSFWNRVLRPVMEEIGNKSPLAPALVAANSQLPVKLAGARDVEFCVREVGSEIFILACKREGATVKVEFSGLLLANCEGQVMYESPRKVEVTDGKFSDWFGPFEVHVYRFNR